MSQIKDVLTRGASPCWTQTVLSLTKQVYIITTHSPLELYCETTCPTNTQQGGHTGQRTRTVVNPLTLTLPPIAPDLRWDRSRPCCLWVVERHAALYRRLNAAAFKSPSESPCGSIWTPRTAGHPVQEQDLFHNKVRERQTTLLHQNVDLQADESICGIYGWVSVE